MMKIVPIELKELNAMVVRWHRHHKRVQGHRFSIGVESDGNLVGGCSVGRPVARRAGNPKEVLEVTRLVTDGTRNACSMLYSRAARVGHLLGYKKIQTYILDTESGASLRAAGWTCEDDNCGGGQWNHSGLLFNNRRNDQPQCRKQRWSKTLGDCR